MSPSGAPAMTAAARARRLTGPVVAACALGVGVLAARALSQGDAGLVACPFRALTGLDCPFCGATRATAALADGNLLAAADHNLLFVTLLVPLALVGWLLWLRSAATGREFPLIPNWALKAFFWVVLAWWGLRLVVPWLGSSLSG